MNTYFNTKTNQKEYILTSERKDYHKNLFNQKGKLNSNFSNISDDEIIENAEKFIKMYNVIPNLKTLYRFCKLNDLKMIQYFTNFRFNEYGGGFNGFLKRIRKKYNNLEYILDSNENKQISKYYFEKFKEYLKKD